MSQPLPSPDRRIRGAGRRRSSSAWSSTPSSSLLARLAPRPPGSVRSCDMRPSRILDAALEQQSAEQRREYQARRLAETLRHARASSPYFRRTLPGTVEALEQIPITRKDDLPPLQAADPPFRGLLPVEPARPHPTLSSPAPIP